MAVSKDEKCGVTGDGVVKARESLDALRTSCGVCGERLGVEAQLEAGDRECESDDVVDKGCAKTRACSMGAGAVLHESLSNCTFRPLLFLPSIM